VPTFKQCVATLVPPKAWWPELHVASDHVDFYDAPQEDGGHRVLIGREVNEADAVDGGGYGSNKGHEAVAKATPEVMVVNIAAVVTMDEQNNNEADAVDCEHGEAAAMEAEGMVASCNKSVCSIEGMVGGVASFSCYCASKISKAFSKEDVVEAAVREAEGMVAAVNTFVCSTERMVGGITSFSRSHASKSSNTFSKEDVAEAEVREAEVSVAEQQNN
jgi:hypothetical protein